MGILNKIILSGVVAGRSASFNRGTMMANYISLISVTLLMILFLFRLIVTKDAQMFRYWFPGMLLFLMPIVLARLNFPTVGKMLLCYVPVLFSWFAFVSGIKNMETFDLSFLIGLRIFLLGMVIIPYLVFEIRRPLFLIIGILPTFISLFFLDQIVGLFFEFPIDSEDYRKMPIRTFISFTAISSGSYILQYIIYRNEKSNQMLLLRLNEKTRELKNKNKQLIDSQVKLYELNSNLENIVERKTLDIKKQNEALIKYSYANAHHVRGPLARILGLISLLELDENISHEFVLESVKYEAESLDKIVSRISEELNEIDQGNSFKD